MRRASRLAVLCGAVAAFARSATVCAAIALHARAPSGGLHDRESCKREAPPCLQLPALTTRSLRLAGTLVARARNLRSQLVQLRRVRTTVSASRRTRVIRVARGRTHSEGPLMAPYATRVLWRGCDEGGCTGPTLALHALTVQCLRPRTGKHAARTRPSPLPPPPPPSYCRL